MPLSGQKELDELIKQWVKWDHNADTLNQIMEAVENKNWKVYVLLNPRPCMPTVNVSTRDS